MKTLDIKKFENVTGNLFKGILMISKRARQINNVYQIDAVREVEDYDEEFPEEFEPDELYESKPKAIVVAKDEFMEGKIKLLEKDF